MFKVGLGERAFERTPRLGCGDYVISAAFHKNPIG